MKQVCTAIIAMVVIAAGLQRSEALTVDELGTGPAEIVMINSPESAHVPVDAGVLELNVGRAPDGRVLH